MVSRKWVASLPTGEVEAKTVTEKGIGTEKKRKTQKRTCDTECPIAKYEKISLH